MTISNGSLVLSGGASTMLGDNRAEVQSIAGFNAGVVLTMAISSSSWKPASVSTDSSFGFDLVVNDCRYGVLVTGNGHLGIIGASPGSGGNCSGPPPQQFVPISNWESLRSAGPLRFVLSWGSGQATVLVDGSGYTGTATFAGPEVPVAGFLKVRLNSDELEQYSIDYMKIADFREELDDPTVLKRIQLTDQTQDLDAACYTQDPNPLRLVNTGCFQGAQCLVVEANTWGRKEYDIVMNHTEGCACGDQMRMR